MVNQNKVQNLWASKFGKGFNNYGKTLQKGIAAVPGDYLMPEFMNPLYSQIGQQQQAASRNLQSQYGQALGSNTSGMLGREQAALTQGAPYGSAMLAAQQQGFNRLQQLGNALSGLKSLESSWRSARINEAQNKKALNNQIALAGAQAGGASGGGSLLDSLLPALGGALVAGGI